MPATNFLPATYSVEVRGNQWLMVVEERGQREEYPAASRVGAEVMVTLERERRGDLPSIKRQ